MKASHRRAIDRAVTSRRCPSCNRIRLAVAVFEPVEVHCVSCGFYGPATTSVEERPHRGGVRVVATVEVTR